MAVNTLYGYSEGLTPTEQSRYIAKLKLLGVARCPFKEDEGIWSTNIKEWPQLQYPDVYDYLINTARESIFLEPL